VMSGVHRHLTPADRHNGLMRPLPAEEGNA
jgi:hypothetical protein